MSAKATADNKSKPTTRKVARRVPPKQAPKKRATQKPPPVAKTVAAARTVAARAPKGTSGAGRSADSDLAERFDAALERVKQNNANLRAELNALLAQLG